MQDRHVPAWIADTFETHCLTLAEGLSMRELLRRLGCSEDDVLEVADAREVDELDWGSEHYEDWGLFADNTEPARLLAWPCCMRSLVSACRNQTSQPGLSARHRPSTGGRSPRRWAGTWMQAGRGCRSRWVRLGSCPLVEQDRPCQRLPRGSPVVVVSGR